MVYEYPDDVMQAHAAAMKRVGELAEQWENATEVGSGQPSIVARAFAAELRKAISGEVS